ncbi:hypothetical protein LOTGIDRAFT_176049 [Lottia gigantea]|uniref:Uncharacterized protein n=1 Tax=Lottia gigantea TaxID=225164 RepID=V3ZNR7_LOTGI|nr:hypothetical protein LOTGIDRAFT_176049 [Lottia gigantea]ESO85952.1 hypothetical protein LOTGIDRAFT_176049 [Lottia gigantea]
MADSTKKSLTSTSASKSTFDLASIIFEKDKSRKSVKRTDSFKTSIKSTATGGNLEKVTCSPSEMAARNRPSSSKNKDDAIIETSSFSKDNSQTFADFKMEMLEMHKKSFEEIQLIIANSMDNLRQPESRRTDKRPICGRKRVISESDVNNDRSEEANTGSSH